MIMQTPATMQTQARQRPSFGTTLLLALLTFYQRCISPVLPSACKFYPTCSQYAREAVLLYGTRRGVWMALKRLLRCRPFARGGYDPVE